MHRPPREQHTVSKVVLRRFAVNKKVSVYDRHSDSIYPKGPGGIFRLHDFDGHEPLEAERRWGAVEQHMTRTYRLIDQRKVLGDPEAVDVLRDLLAVHWVRSASMRVMQDRVFQQVLDAHRGDWARRPDLLSAAYTQRTGLLPAGPGALAWTNEELHRISPQVRAEIYSRRNAMHYGWARQKFATGEVQIAYAKEGDFVIGDAPVITAKTDFEGLGPHQGVALNEASVIIMPISPGILIGLGTKPMYLDIDQPAVETYNQMQVRSFIRWLGARPGGPSDRQMRAEIPARRIYG